VHLEKQSEKRVLKMFKRVTVSSQDTSAVCSIEEDNSWFEVFWEKSKHRILSQHVISDKKRSIHEEHLYIERKRIERQMKKYWRVRTIRGLKMLFLHLRRRQRAMLAFSFLKYKINVLKMIVYQRKVQKPRFLMLKH
jgi:hypothetical protein